MQKVRRHFFKEASTDWKFFVSGSISLPCLGFFSPFPHGTCSLLVLKTYLGLEGGSPLFKQINRSTCKKKVA